MVRSGQKYKIKLVSGRVLGPIGLDRIRRLILKNHIQGSELARQYPLGDWVEIGSIDAIADLMIARAEGRLERMTPDEAAGPRPFSGQGTTRMLPPQSAQRTVVLPSRSGTGKTPPIRMDLAVAPRSTPPEPRTAPSKPGEEETDDKTAMDTRSAGADGGSDDEKTSIRGSLKKFSEFGTRVISRSKSGSRKTWLSGLLPARRESRELEPTPRYSGSSSANQPTIMMANPFAAADGGKLPRRPGAAPKDAANGKKARIVGLLATLAVAYILIDLIGSSDDSGPTTEPERFAPVRPALPAFDQAVRLNSARSQELYAGAMGDYIKDNVAGYKAAAKKLSAALQSDIGNVKALAMLASCYLNLIDSANKDENYFTVISKLIELSKARNVDLTETVIAEVEFAITVAKPEEAQNRIIEYTRTHASFGPELFYYMARSFYERGAFPQAASFIAQYPEAKFFSPKVFYLRGQIAEKLDDSASALAEYNRAVKMSSSHARSRLAIARLLVKQNRVQEAGKHIEYLVHHANLLSPPELAQAYYLHALWSENQKNNELALLDMDRAIGLDGQNEEYQLELYQLKGRTGTAIKEIQPVARMYFFLGEGEKRIQEGQTQEALTFFLQAREANEKSALPLLKMGDMFYRLHDLGNARTNYKMAGERAPRNISVWSKYIDVLIQSYEWDEATQAMDIFRKLPVDQSAIDKAAADILSRQGMHSEAQFFYKKAMARDVIDPGVYMAYARSLASAKNCKEAPFFYALARRIDPLNVEALIGTARCVAMTEGADRAVSLLEDELQKGNHARAEILSAIADFMIEKGNWTNAQEYVRQAMDANPNYAYPWKLQAQIYLNQEGTVKGALDKALDAFGSYSERNNSDPSGYLERYRVYVRKGEFERASEELGKIFAIYPKFPNLHYYKGALYSIMGNHKAAVDEFKVELGNNPNSLPTLLAYGKELVELGKVNDALQLFNKAMQISPRSSDAKVESGYANYLLKNYQGAIALYQAALSIDSGNPLIYKRMGLAYRDMEDMVGAARSFREYLRMEPDAVDKDEFSRYIR